MKVEFAALVSVILYRFVFADDFELLRRCPEYKPQNELDIERISGLWFGAELITHYETRNRVQSFDSCIIINIEEIVEWGDYNYDYDDRSVFHSRRIDYSPMNYRFLKVQMTEGDNSAEYTLKFNGTKRGLWIGAEPPKGSILRRHSQHTHFTGTIQVLKAVANHLVLTFCEREELFTVIFTRTKSIAVDDVESIHNIILRRGLSMVSYREVCRYYSSAMRQTPLTALSLLIVLILLKI